jgi:hypothetical protein
VTIEASPEGIDQIMWVMRPSKLTGVAASLRAPSTATISKAAAHFRQELWTREDTVKVGDRGWGDQARLELAIACHFAASTHGNADGAVHVSERGIERCIQTPIGRCVGQRRLGVSVSGLLHPNRSEVIQQNLCAKPIDFWRTRAPASFDPQLIRNLLGQLAKQGT